MNFLLLGLLFLLPIQDKPLPEYGDISDLKGMTRVYVTSESSQIRKYILAELKKYPALTVVNSSSEGEFILECQATPRTHQFGFPDSDTFEMRAYIIRDNRKRIAWEKTKEASLRYPPTLLTREFIDTLKKSRKL